MSSASCGMQQEGAGAYINIDPNMEKDMHITTCFLKLKVFWSEGEYPWAGGKLIFCETGYSEETDVWTPLHNSTSSFAAFLCGTPCARQSRGLLTHLSVRQWVNFLQSKDNLYSHYLFRHAYVWSDLRALERINNKDKRKKHTWSQWPAMIE